jgi:hypothetical protein
LTCGELKATNTWVTDTVVEQKQNHNWRGNWKSLSVLGQGGWIVGLMVGSLPLQIPPLCAGIKVRAPLKPWKGKKRQHPLPYNFNWICLLLKNHGHVWKVALIQHFFIEYFFNFVSRHFYRLREGEGPYLNPPSKFLYFGKQKLHLRH